MLSSTVQGSFADNSVLSSTVQGSFGTLISKGNVACDTVTHRQIAKDRDGKRRDRMGRDGM